MYNFYIWNGLIVDIVGPRVCCSSVSGELKIQRTTQIFFYASHTSLLPLRDPSTSSARCFLLSLSTHSRTKNHRPPTRLPAPEPSIVFGRPLSLFQLSFSLPTLYIFQPIVPVYRHPHRFPTHQTRPHPSFWIQIARGPKSKAQEHAKKNVQDEQPSVYSRVLDPCSSKRSAGSHPLALLSGLKGNSVDYCVVQVFSGKLCGVATLLTRKERDSRLFGSWGTDSLFPLPPSHLSLRQPSFPLASLLSVARRQSACFGNNLICP